MDSEFEEIHDRIKLISKDFEKRKRRLKKSKRFEEYKAVRATARSSGTPPASRLFADQPPAAPKCRLAPAEHPHLAIPVPKGCPKRPTTLEVFCGCGALSAELEKAGFAALGIDFEGNKDKPSCKSVYLDLTAYEGQLALLQLIAAERPVFVHFAPPCGTASLAREIRRRRPTDGSKWVDPPQL